MCNKVQKKTVNLKTRFWLYVVLGKFSFWNMDASLSKAEFLGAF